MKNNGETLRQVSLMVEELKDGEHRQKIMNSRQARLKELTRKYDIEVVALACGFTVSTLAQYLRVKNPSNIGEESVSQAEFILNNL